MWNRLEMWKLFRFNAQGLYQSVRRPGGTTTKHEGVCDEGRVKGCQVTKSTDTTVPESCTSERIYRNSRQRKRWDWVRQICRWNNAFWASHSVLEAVGLGFVAVYGLRRGCKHVFGSDDLRYNTQTQAASKNIQDRILKVVNTASVGELHMTVLPTWHTIANARSNDDKDSTGVKVLPTGHYCPRPLDLNKTDGDAKSECSIGELRLQIELLANEYAARIQNATGVQLAQQSRLEDAVREFQAAGELGSNKAKYNLGICYERGIGVQQDTDKARWYYSLAAAGGHGDACYNLAIMYLEGKGGPANEEEGMQLMEKASNAGIKEAQTYLGARCMHHEQFDQAALFFEAAARQNDADAAYYLGLCYEGGLGVSRDFQLATTMFSQAASLGHSEALYILGTYYEHGFGGLQEDYEQALNMYQAAASKGHTLGQQHRTSLMMKLNTDDSKDEPLVMGKRIHSSHSSPSLMQDSDVFSQVAVQRSSSSSRISFSIFDDFLSSHHKTGSMDDWFGNFPPDLEATHNGPVFTAT